MARPKAITKLSETPSNGKKNWLIYGLSGEGKSVLAGTAPRALFLTVEAAGTESAKLYGSKADEWVMDSKETLDEALEYFKNGSGCQDYDWVLHDSLGEIEDLYWYYLQGDRNSKKIQEYPEVETMLKKWVDSWNRLPVNVLYTATEMTIEIPGETEDDDPRPLIVPALGTQKGKAALSIAAKASLVGRLKTHVRTTNGEDEELRILAIRSGNGFIAKDRHGLAPKTGRIKNPNIAKMFERAQAALASSREEPQEQEPEPSSSNEANGSDGSTTRRRRAATTATE